MLKVDNKKAIANLSKKSLKAGKMRNWVAVIAIALTAALFMAVFTIGGSILTTMQESTMRQVGTSAHAGFKFLTEQQYETLCQDPKIKDISYNIIVGFGENPELNKTYTEIRYTEPKAAEWSFAMPTVGRLPEKGLEIAASTAVLDALGVPHQLGAEVPLTFTANGVTYNEKFILCGYYEQDIAVNANEAFISREYCDKVAPVLQVPLYEQDMPDSSYMAGSINPTFWFDNSWNLEQKVADLKERCGFDENVNDGVNWAYAAADIDWQFILFAAAALLLILLSGYLIIYNIFYISVSEDIRFYGLLKTVGTTGRQLKKIVRRQALYLCLIGIPVGLAAGWLLGGFLMPLIMQITNIGKTETVSANPLLFVGAALFSLVTVWVSCLRPCRLAAKVSPVEAVRYTNVRPSSRKNKNHENNKKKNRKSRRVTAFSMAFANLQRDKKKTAAVVLSLCLSMILLNSTYSLVNGFDMDMYLKEKMLTDFMVCDASVSNPYSQVAVLDGVSDSVLSEIENLQGLTGMGSVYMQESRHLFNSDQAYKRALEITDREDKNGTLRHPYVDENIRLLKEEKSMYSHIYGVDEYLWSKLQLAADTPLDAEKFKSGDYVIVSSFWDNGDGRYYDVGDKVKIDFGGGESKEYTVLAVGDIPYAVGPQHGHMLDIYFTLPADEYLRQIGKTNPLTTSFDVEESCVDQTEAWLKDYCENTEPNLSYLSRAIFVEEFKKTQMTFSVVGGLLSLILGLIGILNFINAVVTSILARRREFAILQSVGMSGRQLKKMLIAEGLCYAVITVIFGLGFGSVISYLAVKLISAGMWFFVYRFTFLPLLLCLAVLLFFAAAVPITAYRILAKQSIVERLRTIE